MTNKDEAILDVAISFGRLVGFADTIAYLTGGEGANRIIDGVNDCCAGFNDGMRVLLTSKEPGDGQQ